MTRLGVASVVLAHAFAVTITSRCHYFAPVPTRTEWFVAEFVLALVLWQPCRWYVRWVWEVAIAAPLTRLGGPVVAGLVLNVWWARQLDRLLWIHVQTAQLVLEPVFVIADWLSVSAMIPGGLVVLVKGDPEPTARRTSKGPDHTLGCAAGYGGIALAFALFLLVANLFTIWFVSSERTIYYWDTMGYWTWSAEFAETTTRSPADGWHKFRHSVQHHDYGLLPTILPATAMALYGDHRLVYVLAVVNGHLLAVAVAMTAFVRRLIPLGDLVAVVLPLVFLITSPILWMPVVRGYLDIGGVALAVLTLVVYLSRPVTELRWQQIVGTAALLVALALFRRWYNFWVVSFLLVAGIEGAIVAVRVGWRALRPSIAVGVVSALLLLALALPFVLNIALMDYTAAYSSYREPAPFLDRVMKLFDTTGWFVPVVIVGSALGLLAIPGARRLTAYLGGGVVVIVAAFLRTQDFGLHHYYLFLPALVLLPSMLLAHVLARRPRWMTALVLSLFVAWGLVAMLSIHGPGVAWLHTRLRPVVPRHPHPPLIRHDLDELQRLLRFLDDETDRTDESIVILSSGPDFNQTTFRSARRSLRVPFFAEVKLLPAPEVDRVSGFPSTLFEAGLVVVADPPQFHLRESEQQTVLIPARELLAGMGIGKAFDRLPVVFQLERDVKVFVFRRARPIDPIEFAAFREKLRQAQPDLPRVFTP